MAVRVAFQEGAATPAKALSQIDGGEGWALYAMLVGAQAIIRAIPDAAVQQEIREDVVRKCRG